MAVYKVPQDVEADDKLIGPFSFRQFVYLIIAFISIAVGWGLSRLFIPLAIIPLPLVIFFGALALPLRKDQPMEVYLAAVVSFYFLKPRKRLWQPDGIQSLVEITAPKTVEVQRSKDLSQDEAQQRLSYLANIVDTGGWAVRGVAMPQAQSAMQSDAFFEAQQTVDILDTTGGVARSLDMMISQADARRREEMLERMHQVPATPIVQQSVVPPPVPDPYANLTATPAVTPQDDPHVSFNPYPNSMHQMVIKPMSEQQAPEVTAPVVPEPVAEPAQPTPEPEVSTSEKQISPDIINLANNSDLSIETIAHEANRIHQKEKDEDEVVISLR